MCLISAGDRRVWHAILAHFFHASYCRVWCTGERANKTGSSPSRHSNVLCCNSHLPHVCRRGARFISHASTSLQRALAASCALLAFAPTFCLPAGTRADLLRTWALSVFRAFAFVVALAFSTPRALLAAALVGTWCSIQVSRLPEVRASRRRARMRVDTVGNGQVQT